MHQMCLTECCKGVWAKGEGGSDGGNVRRGKGLKLVRRRKGTGGGGGRRWKCVGIWVEQIVPHQLDMRMVLGI